jgi:hypothetical protein
MLLSYVAEFPAARSRRPGGGAMTDDTSVTIPLDHLGQPDLQALVRQCGGYDKITPELWAAWDRANAEWQARRRAGLASPSARKAEPPR